MRPVPRLDEIEEGEIIDTSDDDDCVLLESPSVAINIDEDESDTDTEPFSSEKFFKACQRRAEKIATPKIFKDSQREPSLFIKPMSENALLYSTLNKSNSSADISCIELLGSPEAMPRPKPNENNDSVILLEDSIGDDFIPLVNPLAKSDKKSPKKTPLQSKKKKSGRMNISTFTTAEKRKWETTTATLTIPQRSWTSLERQLLQAQVQ